MTYGVHYLELLGSPFVCIRSENDLVIQGVNRNVEGGRASRLGVTIRNKGLKTRGVAGRIEPEPGIDMFYILRIFLDKIMHCKKIQSMDHS